MTRGLDHRINAVTDSAGRRTDFHYDTEGRLTHTTRLAGTPGAIDGPVTEYGPLDRPVSITDELDKTTTFDHDDHGNLTRITERLGRITTIEDKLTGQDAKVTKQAGGPVWSRPWA